MKKSLLILLVFFSVPAKASEYKNSHLKYYGNKVWEGASGVFEYMKDPTVISVLASLPVVRMNYRHHVKNKHLISDRFSYYFMQIGAAISCDLLLQLFDLVYYTIEMRVSTYYDSDILLSVHNDLTTVIDFNHETIRLFLSENDTSLSCLDLLEDTKISPFQAGSEFRISFIIPDYNSNADVVSYTDGNYGGNSNYWFEQACADKTITAFKEPISAINKDVFLDICSKYFNGENKRIIPKNKYEYAYDDNVVVVRVSKVNHLSVYNVCDIKKGTLALVKSDREDIKFFLHEYLLNTTLSDNKQEGYIISLGELAEVALLSFISTLLFDYVSFYLLSGTCSGCKNKIKFPGFPTCEDHWYCPSCLTEARKWIQTRCPACGHRAWKSIKTLVKERQSP